MADRPRADISADRTAVEQLVTSIPPGVLSEDRTVAAAPVAGGWDCVIWRLGADLAVRVPRRRIAAELIRNEQRFLPGLAQLFTSAGVSVPAPVFCGEPTDEFAWPWSVVPWVSGQTAIDVPRAARGDMVDRLARALRSLHRPAPPGAPANPYRGVPLSMRDAAVRARLGELRERGVDRSSLRVLHDVWEHGCAADRWSGTPVWIHGDLHPGNLVMADADLVGVIDFGDLTSGDPAYDLAVAWLAFDSPARARFRSLCRTDDETWVRARAWAAGVVTALLAHSDDHPAYRLLALDSIRELNEHEE